MKILQSSVGLLIGSFSQTKKKKRNYLSKNVKDTKLQVKSKVFGKVVNEVCWFASFKMK